MLLFKFREFVMYIKKDVDSFMYIAILGSIDFMVCIISIMKIRSLIFNCAAILSIMLASIWLLYESLVVNERDHFSSSKEFIREDIDYFHKIFFARKLKEIAELLNKRSIELNTNADIKDVSVLPKTAKVGTMCNMSGSLYSWSGKEWIKLNSNNS